MNVKIHSIKFDADEKLISFIEAKTQKLEQMFDNIIEAEIFLRLDKNQNTENKITEIKLSIPGSDLFAKKQCKSFEESADQSINALRKQLSKYKEKIRGN
eukprot:Anaeramoba_ignava/a220065_5.p1 GENE.a220065_5~~a220065_5.p1  ORF type:complete len:100 (+),score=10.42 a220065_5:283-582(+)